jgi:hypothetical protein
MVMRDTAWVRRHIASSSGAPKRRRSIAALTIVQYWFRPQRLIGIIASLAIVSIAGGIVLALSLLPFQYRQARQRWEQQDIRHYQLEVTWASGWSFGHARVEMRDNKVVRAIDLDTGQPLDSGKLLSAGYFASIDRLFEIIDARMQPTWAWRNLLARLSPSLARRIDGCVAPLSDVGYDPQFGFPSRIAYNDGWCTVTFFDYSNVTITGFQPLP